MALNMKSHGPMIAGFFMAVAVIKLVPAEYVPEAVRPNFIELKQTFSLPTFD